MDITAKLLEVLQGQTQATEKLSEAYKDSDSSGGSKLVDKNIVKSSEGSSFDTKKGRKSISSRDKTDIAVVADIFAAKYVDMMKKSQKDTFLKAKTTKKKSTSKGSGKVGGVVKDVAQGLGLGSIIAALMAVSGKIIPMAKKVWKIFKNSKLGKSIIKMAKSISSTLKTVFTKIKDVLVKVFTKIWGFMKRFGKFVAKIFGRISEWAKPYLKVIGEKIASLWKTIKGIFNKVVGKIISLGKKIGAVVAKVLGKLPSATALVKSIGKLTGSIGKVINGIIDSIIGLKDKAEKVVKRAVEFVKNPAKGVWNAAKAVGGKAMSTAKAVGGTAAKGIKVVGGAAVKGVKSVGKMAFGPAQKLFKKALGVVSKNPSKLLGGIARRVPLIGTLIESLLTHNDLKKLKQQHANGEIDTKQLNLRAGTRVVKGVTGIAGAGLGAVLGGALGSVVPVAGNAIGAILGGVFGDIAGKKAGGMLVNNFLSKKMVSGFGSHVISKMATPKKEMQDFIVKGDNVYPFSNKDEVVGMKTGGAFQQVMEGAKGGNAVVHVQRTNKILMKQIEQMNILLQYTKIIAEKENSGGGAAIVPMSLPAPKESNVAQLAANNNRDSYSNSPYSY